jgi:hypothetical protein
MRYVLVCEREAEIYSGRTEKVEYEVEADSFALAISRFADIFLESDVHPSTRLIGAHERDHWRARGRSGPGPGEDAMGGPGGREGEEQLRREADRKIREIVDDLVRRDPGLGSFLEWSSFIREAVHAWLMGRYGKLTSIGADRVIAEVRALGPGGLGVARAGEETTTTGTGEADDGGEDGSDGGAYPVDDPARPE